MDRGNFGFRHDFATSRAVGDLSLRGVSQGSALGNKLYIGKRSCGVELAWKDRTPSSIAMALSAWYKMYFYCYFTYAYRSNQDSCIYTQHLALPGTALKRLREDRGLVKPLIKAYRPSIHTFTTIKYQNISSKHRNSSAISQTCDNSVPQFQVLAKHPSKLPISASSPIRVQSAA